MDATLFFWLGGEPGTLHVYTQTGNERRIPWIVWRAEDAREPLQKEIVDFPRFYAYFRDAGNFSGASAGANSLVLAKQAWCLWTGTKVFPKELPPLTKRQVAGVKDQLPLVICGACHRPLLNGLFTPACSRECLDSLCRHCDSKLEVVEGELDYFAASARKRLEDKLAGLVRKLEMRSRVEEFMNQRAIEDAPPALDPSEAQLMQAKFMLADCIFDSLVKEH